MKLNNINWSFIGHRLRIEKSLLLSIAPLLNAKNGSVAKIILLPFYTITIAFCIIIDLFMHINIPFVMFFTGFVK
jgi:hypothetical protein